MAINSRSKGQRGEREVRDILQTYVDIVADELRLPFAPEIKRNLVQSREGGHDLVGLPGLAVEVKFCETLQIDKWWEQTLQQASRARATPVLIYRRKNQKWKVVMLGTLPCGAVGVPCRVEVSLETFIDWFVQHLHLSLG